MPHTMRCQFRSTRAREIVTFNRFLSKQEMTAFQTTSTLMTIYRVPDGESGTDPEKVQMVEQIDEDQAYWRLEELNIADNGQHCYWAEP
jgi:hypothetical protein